jgi:CBS domain containing-hemolysin-like protein
MTFAFLSSKALGRAGYVIAVAILAVFVLLGILFDAVGVAIMSAHEAPFHSMAAHHERGAVEAIRLIKNSQRAATICNDVVGDIAGIVSGTTAALIASKLSQSFTLENAFIQLIISGIVTGATIGGKAIGKTAAVGNSTAIVLNVGRIIGLKNRIFRRRGG